MVEPKEVPAAPEVKNEPKSEIDISNPQHPLHPSNGDLRILPLDYEVPQSTGVMEHHDLRILPANEE